MREGKVRDKRTKSQQQQKPRHVFAHSQRVERRREGGATSSMTTAGTRPEPGTQCQRQQQQQEPEEQQKELKK